jgi:hypothetical protein
VQPRLFSSFVALMLHDWREGLAAVAVADIETHCLWSKSKVWIVLVMLAETKTRMKGEGSCLMYHYAGGSGYDCDHDCYCQVSQKRQPQVVVTQLYLQVNRKVSTLQTFGGTLVAPPTTRGGEAAVDRHSHWGRKICTWIPFDSVGQQTVG